MTKRPVSKAKRQKPQRTQYSVRSRSPTGYLVKDKCSLWTGRYGYLWIPLGGSGECGALIDARQLTAICKAWMKGGYRASK